MSSCLARAFSTSARRLKPSSGSPFSDVQGAINSLAASQREDRLGIEAHKTRRGNDTKSSFISFRANKDFVRPFDLTRESREKKPMKLPRRPHIGPSKQDSEASDLFHQFDLDPMDLALNPLILSEFVTQMGMIKPRTETRLTRRSQRRVSKAIRRARMMGVFPQFSKPKLSKLTL